MSTTDWHLEPVGIKMTWSKLWLLAEMFMNLWMEFYETFRKLSLDVPRQLFNICNQSNPRWQPQLTNIIKLKTRLSIHNINSKCHSFRRSLPKMSASSVKLIPGFLLAKYVMNQRMVFSKTLKKLLMNIHLQLIMFWSQPDQRWTPRSSKLTNAEMVLTQDVLKLSSWNLPWWKPWCVIWAWDLKTPQGWV